MSKLSPEEVHAYSAQLTPGVQALVALLKSAWVQTNEVHLDPWHELSSGDLCWGKHPSGEAILRVSNIRVRENSGWQRELGDPTEGDSTPEEAITREWNNASSQALQVNLSEQVQVSQGVQSVKADSTNWNHSWGLGASLKTTVSTKASAGVKAGVFSGSAEASASLEASINATYSGSTGGSSSTTDTTNQNQTVTRTVQQGFTVAPWTKLKVTALSRKQTLLVPYVDALPVDFNFKFAAFGNNAWGFANYWRDNFGPAGRIQGDSIVEWLDGFFDPSKCDCFEPSLDLNFPWNDVSTSVANQVRALKNDPVLSVQRTGQVSWAKASGFEFALKEESLPHN